MAALVCPGEGAEDLFRVVCLIEFSMRQGAEVYLLRGRIRARLDGVDHLLILAGLEQLLRRRVLRAGDGESQQQGEKHDVTCNGVADARCCARS
jgi:hypothetical protein